MLVISLHRWRHQPFVLFSTWLYLILIKAKNLKCRIFYEGETSLHSFFFYFCTFIALICANSPTKLELWPTVREKNVASLAFGLKLNIQINCIALSTENRQPGNTDNLPSACGKCHALLGTDWLGKLPLIVQVGPTVLDFAREYRKKYWV